MMILGIESSCDETAVAITSGNKILSSIVASQNDIHSRFGGVVPELASRRHAEVIFTLLESAFEEAGVTMDKIDGVAVTKAPGLIGAVLVGLSTAKAIAYATGKPLIGVNHLEGHLNAVHLREENVPYPHIGLIVSGGHTSLYLVKDFGKYKLIGATRDDAAGEAFDKVARLLGLGYPGGPIIDKMAPSGDPKAFKFSSPQFRNAAEFDFSFSGLKTAVMLEYKKLTAKNKISDKDLKNLVASFQSTAIGFLVKNILAAAKEYKCKAVVVSGGVAANKGLRANLEEIADKNDLKIFVPPFSLCTDNAAMIAYVGGRYLEKGIMSDLNLNAQAVEEIGV